MWGSANVMHPCVMTSRFTALVVLCIRLRTNFLTQHFKLLIYSLHNTSLRQTGLALNVTVQISYHERQFVHPYVAIFNCLVFLCFLKCFSFYFIFTL